MRVQKNESSKESKIPKPSLKKHVLDLYTCCKNTDEIFAPGEYKTFEVPVTPDVTTLLLFLHKVGEN